MTRICRRHALRNADFATPFAEQASAHPLGTEPILAGEVQLTPLSNGHLRLVIVDGHKRHVQLQLTETLATAVRELMAKALHQADWGITFEGTAAPAPDATPSRLLN